jgi:hypothetical protein
MSDQAPPEPPPNVEPDRVESDRVESPTDGGPDRVEPAPRATPGAHHVFRPPPARLLISRGIDLALRESSSIREASLAIGFQLMGAAGPFVVLLLIVAGRTPGILDLFASNAVTADAGQAGAVVALLLSGSIGGLALIALSLESRILAVAILGGRAVGRPVTPHEALRRSRATFWRVLVATIVIQIPLTLLSNVVSGVIPGVEAAVVVATVVVTIASAPFAYLLTGIVLGDASAGLAIRRSVEMARVRWRLALVAAIAETLAQTLLIFGLSAGLDIVSRVADALGLGLGAGNPMTFLTIVVALLCTAAVGSLIFTVSAIAAAPQVVAFVGLTGYGAGLDPARDAPDARPVHWVSIPMAMGIVFATVVSLAGVASALGSGR